jgi:hypothetical protein
MAKKQSKSVASKKPLPKKAVAKVAKKAMKEEIVIPTTHTKAIVEESQFFKQLSTGASDEETIEVYQHNIQLVFRQQEYLISTTLIDSSDAEVIAVMARIFLIDRKLMAMGKKVSELLAKK